MVTHVSSSFTLGEFSGTTWYQCACSIFIMILTLIGFFSARKSNSWHVTPL